MIHSKIFEKEILEKFEKNVLDFLNVCEDFDNKRIISSPRAVGDAVQEVIGENLLSCMPVGLIKEYKGKFARRAMADLFFRDCEDNCFVVDIKTHNKNTSFNMPNLTSGKRLVEFYENDKNFFVVLLVEYSIVEDKIVFEKVKFVPIENLKWECLTIGALGWGQIQIKNANIVSINKGLTRKEWMIKLCSKMQEFYPKEILKIKKRSQLFADKKQFWKNK